MIGTVLGSAMLGLGVILTGWGSWRVRRPLRFFSKLREYQTNEREWRRWEAWRKDLKNAGKAFYPETDFRRWP